MNRLRDLDLGLDTGDEERPGCQANRVRRRRLSVSAVCAPGTLLAPGADVSAGPAAAPANHSDADSLRSADAHHEYVPGAASQPESGAPAGPTSGLSRAGEPDPDTLGGSGESRAKPDAHDNSFQSADGKPVPIVANPGGGSCPGPHADLRTTHGDLGKRRGCSGYTHDWSARRRWRQSPTRRCHFLRPGRGPASASAVPGCSRRVSLGSVSGSHNWAGPESRPLRRRHLKHPRRRPAGAV